MSVRISRRQFVSGAMGAAGAAWTASCSSNNQPMKELVDRSRKPNIVLLFTDEHRWDAMGPAGNAVIQTPVLDRMASEGTNFSRTYCQGPLCQPSRASFITGRYLHEHGLTTNNRVFDNNWPTFMRSLQQAGYETVEFGKLHFYEKFGPMMADIRKNREFINSFGFDDSVEDIDKYASAYDIITPYCEWLKGRGNGLYDAFRRQMARLNDYKSLDHFIGETSVISQDDDMTTWTADVAVDWLRRRTSEKPFFLWVSFVCPHTPFVDDPIWAEVYKDAEIPFGPLTPVQPAANSWGDFLRRLLNYSHVQDLTPEFLTNAARHYYGMVSLIDQKLGDVMAAVQERGWSDNTWFIFTADHGETLGDHGLMDKMTFYKGSVLVPNIIKPPRGMQPKVIDSPVELNDVVATMLDIAGAERMPGMHGQSLVPQMQGEGKPREVAFSQLGVSPNSPELFSMAATDRYRYTYARHAGIPVELFDLQEDPDEMTNLVDDPSYKSIVDDMLKDYIRPYMAGEIG